MAAVYLWWIRPVERPLRHASSLPRLLARPYLSGKTWYRRCSFLSVDCSSSRSAVDSSVDHVTLSAKWPHVNTVRRAKGRVAQKIEAHAKTVEGAFRSCHASHERGSRAWLKGGQLSGRGGWIPTVE
jgi:hypothetical protein